MNNKIKNMKNHKSKITPKESARLYGVLRTNRKYRGFSLVELLVVITIIAILSVVAYMAMGGQTVKARDSKRMQDLTTLQSALEIYLVEKGSYPTATLTSGTGAGQIPKKYLSEIPTDPNSSSDAYVYVKSGTTATYQIAATLENDGVPANFKAYVIGNSDINLITSGVSWNSTTKTFDSCSLVVDNGTCLPYDPTN